MGVSKSSFWMVLFLSSIAFVVSTCGKSGSAPIGIGNPESPTALASPLSTKNMEILIPRDATGMGPSAYGVNPLVISQGTTVTWINQDLMPHTATSTAGVWDSSILSPGQTYSFKFDSLGDFPYLCSVHGAASMSGMIQVIIEK